ncbi:MAG: 2-(1,2-epoxy-1,2-dihydrophenyl)acetyl-CoA isomerase, partial [Gemmatimonadaceae bacterium]|nr:2-(1,2-epoxy-1,2-dihydrophenyl)acetyl-CoA isomerase [Chitinophagaceae bacterium]
GWQKASAIMMLADKISAAEAERMGMIYKVFPDADFESSSKKIAETLSAMPTMALAYIKEALTNSASNDLEAQLSTEDELQQKAAATEDFKEGVKAFLEKRSPVFTGN